jgi:spermidine/putrescine transport system permease protein
VATPPRLRRLLVVYAALMVVFIHLPIISVFLASFNASRFFSFPFETWTLEWYRQAFTSLTTIELVRTSLSIAVTVTLLAVVLGFAGAMAFARYRWRGRSLFQKVVVLPIFFPHAVLGLALLLWFRTFGVTPSWRTAVFAHLIWVVPVVTLVIAIQVYSFDPQLEEAAKDLGASRLRTFWEVTLPVLVPAVRTAAIFAFLLSWLNFPLSLFTTGADSTLPVWIYAKMVGGYTPLVPALGSLAIIAPTLLVGALFGLLWLRGRRRPRIAA